MAWRNLASTTFHPVGQGLFSSGHLAAFPDLPEPQFSWVYDCGSVTSAELVRHSIDRFKAEISKSGPAPVRPTLDLLVLSHFDKDHISGVVSLLRQFRVGTLLVPLVPMWKRLTIVFSHRGYIDKGSLSYLLDPLGFISQIDGVDINRVIVVAPANDDDLPPSDPDAPPLPRDGPSAGSERNSGRTDQSDLVVTPELRPFDEGGNSLPSGDTPQFAVFELPSGGRLVLPGVWEFVPYHDPVALARIDAKFVIAAENLRGDLLVTTSDVARKAALKKLKRHYDSAHRTSRTRNELSLFMYAGILEPFRNTTSVLHVVEDQLDESDDSNGSCRSAGERPRSGVLYTGDGYLNRPERWDHLATFLGPDRVNSILTFQVMHHGSRYNWYPGLARRIQSRYAVCCADRGHNRFCHPHSEVTDDFESQGQLEHVGRNSSFTITSIW